MLTLHLVPHTHWDREWYLTFQSFRVKLVHLMDLLLDILERDPSYLFTLDGQTIVLEDYLAVRPEREAELAGHIQAGRLLIGPWYILPDEFLASPEATARNLLRGAEISARFGKRMDVGYIPDPFGHVGQMPQILRGFGIDTAAFRRGLADEPCEVWWEAPDGTRVLTSYLRDGYDNAVRLPTTNEAFTQAIAERRSSLAGHTAVSHLLLLNGTDHTEPQAEVPALIAQTRHGEDLLILSTLPEYLAAVRREAEARRLQLPIVRGEARQPKRHHLLPGVLSSRVWIKQRSHACETLLERWAEPFSAWAEIVSGGAQGRTVWTGHLTTPRVRHPAALLKEAWRLLLQCQPHDSICGCSIDAVHEEMRTRFDQAQQIGEEITRQSLVSLAGAIDTRSKAVGDARAALVVCNPEAGPRTDHARARIDLVAGLDPFEIVDEDGRPVSYHTRNRYYRPLADLELDADGVQGMRAMVQDGKVLGLAIQGMAVVQRPDHVLVDVALSESGDPNPSSYQAAWQEIDRLLKIGSAEKFRLQAHLATEVEVDLLARSIPSHGYRTLSLRPTEASPTEPQKDGGRAIENERLRAEVAEDGTITLSDRVAMTTFAGLLRLRDEADRGDSYNFCPLEGDLPVEAPAQAPRVVRTIDGFEQALEIELVYRLPARLSPDRKSRSDEAVSLPVRTRLTLRPGVPRLDVEIEVENASEDHRLQARFPLPFAVEEASFDGHYEIVRRPTRLPPATEDWIEQPRPEVPMRCFVFATDGKKGLLVANRGLREASVSADGVIAVTLLRCFGWLSRDDLNNRKGAAGPKVTTPGGQDPGPHRFHLSLIPFAPDPAEAIQQAYAFQSPMRAVGATLHGGRLPAASSLLASSPPEFHLTAVKTSEDGKGLIVRGVNLSDESIEVRLTSRLRIMAASRARLDEAPIDPLEVEGGHRVGFRARPHEIVTLRLQSGSPGSIPKDHRPAGTLV
jgi:alpha-mannosidase